LKDCDFRLSKSPGGLDLEPPCRSFELKALNRSSASPHSLLAEPFCPVHTPLRSWVGRDPHARTSFFF
jgi:hypothetical protein